MGNMTGRASFDLDGLVLEHKRSLFVGVATEANRILRRRGPHLLGPNRAVHIVAVRALDQALIDTMVEGHLKLRFLLQVAGVTKLRLCFRQQKLSGSRVVRRMAGDAADFVLRVQRIDGVHVLRATGVTGQATGVDFLRRNVLEREDLGFVAGARHVVRPGAMAALAALLRGATLFIQCGLPVRRFLPGVVNFLVTGLADLRSHVLGAFG